MRRIIVLTLILGACLCASTVFADDANRIAIDGSTTVGPIAKAFAGYYMRKLPNVNILVSESGSGNGAKSLINGTCNIATMSRFMKDKEFKAAVEKGIKPVAHVVAMDGIAIIVHPANPVKGLTVEQIRKLYTGKVTNWRELGGPDSKVVMVSRDTNSGTYETFNKLVMKKEKVAATAEYVGSNAAARQRVKSTLGAIGYVGLGFVDRSIRALEVNGVKVSNETVASGVYPIARPLFMFTNGYPKLGGHVHAFVTFHLTKKGQEIIQAIGFVPVTKY